MNFVILQICIEENSDFNVSAEWNQSLSANNVTLDQSCYNNENQITKHCADSESQPCLHIEKYYNLSACPPGFEKISQSNNEYCYQTKDALQWDYPCLKSAGASVITDLSDEDVDSLLASLRKRNMSRFFWLPAKRAKFLSQVQWYIPGPKWGHFIQQNNNLIIRTSILKTCLLLDIQKGVLTTEICTEKHPSLCFYIKDINYPAKCPDRYHSARYMPDEGICLGIEYSDTNLTYTDFINNNICKTPMGDGNNNDLTRFIFKKMAELNKLPDNEWCWFTSTYYSGEDNDNTNIFKLLFPEMYISINNIGTLSITNANSSTLLSCMACQTEAIYEKTELMFEYIEENNLMYLTVYYASGLWKYNQNDRGIQCFSDAKGSVRVIDINELSSYKLQHSQNSTFDVRTSDIMIYEIPLITERAAQYWCEGHTIDFSFIKTDKIVVNPQGHHVHVFSLVFKVYVSTEDIQNILETIKLELSSNITNIFNAKKVLLMEYLEYNLDYLMVLMHMDIAIENIHEEPGRNIRHTYNIISKIARSELPKYNYILINISSSMYCLPTTSDDNHMKLNWELTPIGHMAAPNQFCLQENGLPVRRMCAGSYLLGSYWSNVQGNCNQNYKPSHTTTFLYNFVKGQIPDSNTSRFLTDGLGFVLADTNIIIPADIYYLSMSLQHFLNIAHDNQTSIEMGNIAHIAWVMDRISVLDYRYLRLAQTLNSTNIILDSVNHIIEMLVRKNKKFNDDLRNLRRDYVMDYQIAIQPQFIIQISYPSINNISGLAVIRNSSNNTNFMDVKIKPLFKNTTLDEVLSLDNLEIATWLPENVLNSLKRIGNESKANEDTDNEDIHITMNVFHNDAIFQELALNKYKVNSRIVGVSIPGFISNFKYPMPLVYKDLTSHSYEQICGYWNFQKNSLSKAPGYWSNSGCYLKESKNDLVICECYHLTHFGQLLNMGRNKNRSESVEMVKHNKSLNIISLFGSFLSLLGISGIWITATVFQAWRKKAGTKVLLHLSASIALPLIFMIVFNLDNSIIKENNGSYIITNNLKPVCIALGALLHYSVLASFMWMLITAILQFIRYVRVLGVYRPSRFMIKFTLIGWGIPLIPVAIVLILDKDNYIPHLINKQYKYSICYPTGFYMIVGVIVPISIILVINVTLFILIICAISKGPDGKLRSADVDLIGAQLRLSIFLFFLLGLTWIFGIFSFSSNLIWSYLFCLTSTLQGFVLFVYFIICDSQTRNLWVTLMKPQFRLNYSRESITSMSSD